MKRFGSHTKQFREHIPYLHEQMVEIKMQVAAVTFSDPLSRVQSHKNMQPCNVSHLALVKPHRIYRKLLVLIWYGSDAVRIQLAGL